MRLTLLALLCWWHPLLMYYLLGGLTLDPNILV